MNKFTWFSIIYFVIVYLLASKANENIFGPDKEGTYIIGTLLYLILLVIYIAIRLIKKNRNKSTLNN